MTRPARIGPPDILAGVGPALGLRGIITWSRLHGQISLEIEGNFASMGLDPELLFDTEVTAILAPSDVGRQTRARQAKGHRR